MNKNFELVTSYVSSVELLDAPHLIPSFTVLQRLWLPKNERKRAWCKPSTRALAEMLKISRRTIFRHLAELEEKRLIRRKRRSRNGWVLSSLIQPGKRIIRILRYIMKDSKKEKNRDKSGPLAWKPVEEVIGPRKYDEALRERNKQRWKALKEWVSSLEKS